MSIRGQRIALAAAAVLLALAIWLPRISLQRELTNALVIVDVTQSMNVLDYQIDGHAVSRLAFVKAGLRKSLAQLPCGSKLGLGIFAEYRTFLLLTPVEVCANRGELAALIDNLNTQMEWSTGSQVAKALYSGLLAAKEVTDTPAVAFVTDGHESPPISPYYRPEFEGKAGEIHGILIGVGGRKPLPIPKFDPEGKPLGYWKADEVPQIDPYTRGRESNVPGEQMADTVQLGPVPPALRAIPGREHLSSLHEDYLQLLASETQLAYQRADTQADITSALTNSALARTAREPTDIRFLPGLGAMLLIAAMYWPKRGGRPLRSNARRMSAALTLGSQPSATS